MIWTIHAIHAALENVESMANPYSDPRRNFSFNGFFLMHNTKNNGRNATRKNPRDIGLSKRNWLRTYQVSYCV